MSSTIYNHRTLQPTGPPNQGPGQHSSAQSRISESFDIIRQEFDSLASEVGSLRTQREDYESKFASQVAELNLIRQSLIDLETMHLKVRQQYEDEVNRLRVELHAARQGMPPTGPPPPVNPNANLGGPGSLPLGPGPGPGPSSASQTYQTDPYFARDGRPLDRDRDQRMIDREKDGRERQHLERERAMDRERDLRDRDAMRVDRDIRDRPPVDQRDSKRLKTDRIKTDRADQYSPSLGPGLTPKLPPPNPASVGPGLPPAIPQQLPPFSSSNVDLKPVEQSQALSMGPAPSAHSTGFPDDMDLANIPPELKKEGTDWFAVFNPKVKRVLDVSLVHTLMHESVVCCVRFSADGKYLATGCNRTAQIYDTKTGAKTCVLVDDAAGKAGDLYIRSVCFSPDGKYLATGAEDKQIRIWDIAKRRIRNIFDGHQQEIYSLDFSLDGRLIVSGSGDKTARIWDMQDHNSLVLTINDPDSLNNDAGVTSVAISPNGQLVAAGSLDSAVRIWDVATGNLVERLRGHRDSVYSVAFTPDGKGLISGSLDKTLKYWDVSGLMTEGGPNGVSKGGRKEGGGSGGPNGVGAGVAASGGGTASASSANGAAVRKDGEKASQCTMNFTGHKDYVLSVAVSHDGQWVVSGSKDRGVHFWDSNTAIVQAMLQGHKNSVISIDLSPTGSILATGSGDWQARIWSFATI